MSSKIQVSNKSWMTNFGTKGRVVQPLVWQGKVILIILLESVELSE
jgi:hypothetical protein